MAGFLICVIKLVQVLVWQLNQSEMKIYRHAPLGSNKAP